MVADLAKHLLDRADRAKGARGNWESHWQELNDWIDPLQDEFTSRLTPGTKRMDRIFDGTAGVAVENLGAGTYGMMGNPANEWMEIEAEESALNDLHEVNVWCGDVTRGMLAALAQRGNRFYTATIPLYQRVPQFGTGIFYSEEIPSRGGFHFTAEHLSECLLEENRYREVDVLHRRFKWTARQAAQKWPQLKDEGPIAQALSKEPEREFEFQHSVLPAEDLELKLPGGRKFASVYIEAGRKRILNPVRRTGYFEFPFQCPRWELGRNVYGHSVAMRALPDIKMVNQMSKSQLMAGQLAAMPSLLAADESILRGQRATPGQIIYGGIDPVSGHRLVEPLLTNPDVRITLEMTEQRRQAIREAFYWSLLLMVQQPNMTATEFLGRQEEKLRLMGPHLGRIETEFLDPFIDRLFMMMWRGGAFRPPPPIMLRYPGLRVVYRSPLARAQRAGEATSILRTVESTKPLAELDPEVWDNFDKDAAVRGLAAGFGMPARMLRDPREVEAMREQRRQAQALAAAAEPAERMAGALKKATEAVAMGQDVRARAA